MALLKVEAEKLSNNDLVAGVIEEIIDKDDLFAVLPFVKSEGKAYVYNRENALSEGSFLDPVSDTVPEGAATFTEVTTHLRILAGDVDVDKFLDATMGDKVSQKAIQLAAKAKGMARAFRRTVAVGDNGANAKEFDGLANLVDAGQQIVAGVNGAALTLSMLDELVDSVPNGTDAIVMRSGSLRAYKALLRTSSGGTDAAMMQLENFGRPMLTHNGVPIIINDFIAGDVAQGTEANTCSIYAVRLNEVDGLHGLYGGDTAGIVVEDIGTVQNKDASRTRLKWYCGLALKSTKSLAALVGITNV